MDLKKLKGEVFDANLELVRRGLVIYTWGNVSAIDRENGLVVIKPRGIEYEDLTADDMSVTDLDGNMVEGDLKPSVDLDIHLSIYRQFPAIGGIAHTHSTFATAWAQSRRDIPCYGTTHGDHFLGSIPCTEQLDEEDVASDYEQHAGDAIVREFVRRGLDPMQVFGVLSTAHGPFTWGDGAAASVENSVILEELAKMAFLTEMLNGNAIPLEKYVLDKHFFRKHGSNSYFYQKKEKR